MSKYIHPTSEISKKASIGSRTYIWNEAQIRENVTIGENCIVSKGVYVDFGCIIGNFVKIQNYASLYSKTIIDDEVFIGPYVCFANDLNPRSTNSSGNLKDQNDWEQGQTRVGRGASIGAGTIVLPSITIGEYAMVGAGSVVTKNVESYSLVYGNPSIKRGYVCKCGRIITKSLRRPAQMICKECQNQNSSK